MTDTTTAVLRLDRSKDYAECRGERTTEDPLYGVHYWQGQNIKVTQKGKTVTQMVLLPFDAEGVLVEDDGKTEPFQGRDVDGKMVTYAPLYNAAMRQLLAVKMERLAKAAAGQDADEADDSAGESVEIDEADDVNFEAWLRGEARYEPHVLRAAALKRYKKRYPNIAELARDLVLEEELVPEAEVAKPLQRYLPQKAAA